MVISRRRLVFGAIGALSSAALFGGIRQSSPNWRDVIVQRVIYAHVPGIVFEGTDLTMITEHVWTTVLTRKLVGARRLLIYGSKSILLGSSLLKTVPRDDATVELDRKIVGVFFLCTDYLEQEVPGPRVSVTRCPDPYVAGCSNPFATFNTSDDPIVAFTSSRHG
jgi:hypothetical protein